MENLCRICLSCNNIIAGLQSIVHVLNENQNKSELNISGGGKSTILDLIQSITGVNDAEQEKNGYPKKICSECINLLGYAYNFHTRYLKATEYLRERLQRRVDSDHDYFTLESDDVEEIQKDELPVKSEPETVDSDAPTEDYDYGCEAIKKYPCPICLKDFSALELRQHAGTHKSLKGYMRAVPLARKCNFIVDMRKYMKGPLRLQHQCPDCKEYVETGDFREHIGTHKATMDTLLQCRFCPRVFKMLGHLKMHENCHRKEYPYNCATCGKKFVQKSNYECHLLSHDPKAELSYKCSHCEAAFYNPIHLNRHMVIHTENRTYHMKFAGRKCTNCLITFTKDGFEGHHCVPITKSIATATGKKKTAAAGASAKARGKYVARPAPKSLCTICGQQVRNLQMHSLIHSDARPYVCDFCGKGFRYKILLKRHKLIHTGQKPYVCSWCGKSFNSRANMQTHERIHIGNKCHVCDVCGKGFLEKAYLRKHKLIHEKQR